MRRRCCGRPPEEGLEWEWEIHTADGQVHHVATREEAMVKLAVGGGTFRRVARGVAA